MMNNSIENIHWGSTIQVNIIRTIIAGFLWSIIALFMGHNEFWIGLTLPLTYMLFFLPLGILSGWLSKLGIPVVGLFATIVSIIILPADPIMFALHKYKPNLIPVEEYKIIEPSLSIWVYNQNFSST